MKIWPQHLLPSEQFGAWKERNFHVPRRARKIADKNEALADPEIADYLRGHFCPKPFDTMETTDEGLVHVCCPDWLPTPIGSVDNLDKAWTGRAASKIRASIIDGTYRYCSHVDCSLISGRKLLKRDNARSKELAAKFRKEGQAPPAREIVLSHDRSCNLSCPSCRTETIVVGKPKQKRLDDLVETSLLPSLRNARQVYITGSGDPFGSAHFRRLIKRLTRAEFPDLAFHLHSNGQLWDERAWRDLDLSHRVTIAHVSIDAASADTYSVVRRGGSFSRLLKNLSFIKTLRESGEIGTLIISMVVQSLNFREMPAFVDLGKSVSADTIDFQMIRNWGTMPNEEFKRALIGYAHHDFALLRETITRPEFSIPSVNVGNVLEHVRLQVAEQARRHPATHGSAKSLRAS